MTIQLVERLPYAKFHISNLCAWHNRRKNFKLKEIVFDALYYGIASRTPADEAFRIKMINLNHTHTHDQ